MWIMPGMVLFSLLQSFASEVSFSQIALSKSFPYWSVLSYRTWTKAHIPLELISVMLLAMLFGHLQEHTLLISWSLMLLCSQDPLWLQVSSIGKSTVGGRLRPRFRSVSEDKATFQMELKSFKKLITLLSVAELMPIWMFHALLLNSQHILNLSFLTLPSRNSNTGKLRRGNWQDKPFLWSHPSSLIKLSQMHYFRWLKNALAQLYISDTEQFWALVKS